jgi:hypothetical protein
MCRSGRYSTSPISRNQVIPLSIARWAGRKTHGTTPWWSSANGLGRVARSWSTSECVPLSEAPESRTTRSSGNGVFLPLPITTRTGCHTPTVASRPWRPRPAGSRSGPTSTSLPEQRSRSSTASSPPGSQHPVCQSNSTRRGPKRFASPSKTQSHHSLATGKPSGLFGLYEASKALARDRSLCPATRDCTRRRRLTPEAEACVPPTPRHH